ncbi:MAG TPA: helix-turn-helix transcriptional regulator [Acidimicrobiia bacterium]|nr:helix-turn-helix transcriptional regulator [Acidimicrobiia bacterium]
MDAAALLRSTRVRNGLTQAELAHRARTTQPVISAYEHGRREPSIPTLRRLVRAAGEDLEVRGVPRRNTDLPPPDDLAGHGRRLVDLLLLGDALPHRRRGPLTFPRLRST